MLLWAGSDKSHMTNLPQIFYHMRCSPVYLIEKVGFWEKRRNAANSTVHWRFTTEDARIKLHKLYPSIDVC